MDKAKTTRATPGVKRAARAKRVELPLSLRLYIAGGAPNSLRAVANTKAICEEYLTSRYELEIVDLIKHPRRALDDGIIVTPTLLRLRPLPVQRAIGDLSDTVQLLSILDRK